ESMRSGLITADLDGRVTSCNRAAEEITGQQASELLGRPLSELFGGVAGAYLVDASADRAPSVLRSEVRIDRPDGSVAHLGFNIAPLTSENGDVRGAVLIFQDLTEMVQLEEEVRRREKLAALGTMAAGLAHEIRNPLTSIRGSVQVLSSEIVENNDSRRLLEIILRESDRLNRTVTDFLAYARPAPHTPSEFDLKWEISDAIALMKNSAEVGPHHEIVTELPDGDVPFFGDANQLRQVFWNLCRNGLQAMPDGGVLTITLTPAAGGGVQLSISDTGVGMTSQQMESLFLPFASTKVGGTGLGMATVYQFVKDHDGRIDVESDVGVGTRVALQLPGRSVGPLHGAIAGVARNRARQVVGVEADATPKTPVT
ncbi:MAG TPA: ATP-binding protein, partial [Blastocatellia bacterium]|nr:ATP-binding protein [Blastocatellia bacterium]